jgi:quercetin dioxygenase-like cupin family protein
MTINYPHTIENGLGETLIIKSVQQEPDGDRLIVENYVSSGSGPVMHTHWLQDESLTVIKGRLGYQIMGQEKQFAEEGETILFKSGVAHRFWNDGIETLHCKGWVKPAGSLVFFLSALFESQKKSGKPEPEAFDGAYLITRYSSEFDIPEIPKFVKKTIFPMTCLLGKVLGKYKKFANAPAPAGK